MIINLQKYIDSKELYHEAELCSKIIYSMQTDGSVHLCTKEPKNGHHNGLFKLLDELVEYWGWDRHKITLESCSEVTEYLDYNIIRTDFCDPHAMFNTKSPVYEWNKEKYYGMFIGRATSVRTWAIHKHKKFKHNSTGLTSFNEDLRNYMSYPNLVDYFFHSGQTYEEMTAIAPYSDIRDLVQTPDTPIIIPPYNSSNWGRVYEKIAIEIVCETSTEEDCFGPSEKIIRPCYYKRPFLVIGSPGFLEKYRELGYKTFNDLFDEKYDNFSGFVRVDRVFEILNQLIEDRSIETLIESSKDILEHNHQVVIKEQRRHMKGLHEFQRKTKNSK